MENGQSNSFKEQLQELFFFYDRAGIGVIDKPALLSYFSCNIHNNKLLTSWSIKTGFIKFYYHELSPSNSQLVNKH